MKDTYTPVGPFLTNDEEIDLRLKLEDSELVEITDELPDGRLDYIVIKGTSTTIGYISREPRLILLNKENKDLRRYHNHLTDLVNFNVVAKQTC